MAKYLSPHGTEITGTLERLTARALINGISDDGTPEHAGDTEIFWEDQRTATLDGKTIYLDDDGHEFTFDQLKKVEEVEDDEEGEREEEGKLFGPWEAQPEQGLKPGWYWSQIHDGQPVEPFYGPFSTELDAQTSLEISAEDDDA